MNKTEIRISYLERINPIYKIVHTLTTDFGTAQSVINILVNEGYEIKKIEKRSIDCNLYMELESCWKTTGLFDSYINPKAPLSDCDEIYGG
jgi:hypothetical protein